MTNSNGLARAGYVLGLITTVAVIFLAVIREWGLLVLVVLPSLLAIIFSSIGLGQAALRGGRHEAGWGLALGIAALPLYLFVRFLIAVMFGASV